MNILQLTPSIIPCAYSIGVPIACARQSYALRKIGHDVRILSYIGPLRSSIPLDNQVKELQPYIFYKDNLNQPSHSFGFTTHLLIRKCVPLNLQYGFNSDVIISHNFCDAFYGMKIARKYGMKFGIFLHDPSMSIIHFKLRHDLQIMPAIVRYLVYHYASRCSRSDNLSKFVREIGREIINSADFFIAQSNRTANLAYEIYEIRPKVVHLGADPLPAIPSQRGDFALTKSTIRRFRTLAREEKEPIFAACAKAKAKLIVFAPLASENYILSIKHFLRQSNIKNFEVRTNVSTEHLLELYKSCRAYVQWLYGGFGLPSIEAASCGAPLVQTKELGSSELFEHKVDGYFPERQDVDLYAEYIADLIADERKAWKMGKHAWEMCRKWTWKHHAERLVEVIEKA